MGYAPFGEAVVLRIRPENITLSVHPSQQKDKRLKHVFRKDCLNNRNPPR